jgi:hypothetical protein
MLGARELMTSLRVREISALWTVLRQPFVLPKASFGHHECKWERLDLDVLGCLLCGAIHACGDGTCKCTQEVEDGHVCTLSGVVIREKRFVQSEFIAHAHLTDSVTSQSVFEEENAAEEVRNVVEHMLCSDTSKMLHLRNIMCCMTKGKHKLKHAPNLLAACAELVQGLAHPLRRFDLGGRNAVVDSVTRSILHALCGLVHNFHMPLKDGELKTVAVGMLYLMRKGVVFEDVVVLPAVGELAWFLPSESMLFVFFDIRGRTITESENRVKFALRSATRARLLAAGFGIRGREI